MTPEEFLKVYRDARGSAILRTDNTERAKLAMDAAIRGGFHVIEFTFSIPGIAELIKEFSSREGIVVGAGTVLTIEQANLAVEAGASFLVSPVMDPEIIAEANRLGVAMMPGCATPTEMLASWRAGAQLQKLFPGQAAGPTYVKQTLGPMPFLRIVPTSGVTLENAVDYLKAGSFALGFVASLFPPEDVQGERWDVLEERAKAMTTAIASV